MTPPPVSNLSSQATPKWLGRVSRGGGVAALLPLFLPVLSGGLLLVQAGTLAHILHQAIVAHARLDALLPPLTLLAALLVARVLLGLAAEIAATASAEAIKLKLRRALADTLLGRLPVWTAARSSGALSTAMVEQVEALDGYFVRYLPALIQATILPLAFAAVLFPIDWMVGLILLVTMPLIPLFMALVGWGAEAATTRQADALGRLGGRFADRLRGLTTLKLFGRATAETAAVADASEELRTRTMRVMRIAFLSSAVLEFFAALGVAGIALYIGLTFLGLVTLRGAPLTLEAGLFCLLMAPDIYAPLRLLAAHYHDNAAAKAAAAEIAAQFDSLPLPQPAQSAPAIVFTTRTGAATLELTDLSVASPTGRPVIVDASLAVAPGRAVAILGLSGTGKSTLLEAVARLRDYEGSIRLDGEDLRDISEPELRTRLAMLGQRPRIFPGSIADNIRLGRRTACHAAVRLAAQRACVTDFADALPEGLATRLGEDGLGLSGGEIQRIALARLYLRDPGLILLDEPTAHLDTVTEAKVLDGLMQFASGRTLLVATHSAAVASRMDKVLRIASGKLLPTLRPAVQMPAQRGAA